MHRRSPSRDRSRSRGNTPEAQEVIPQGQIAQIKI